MRTLCKKALALCVVFALALTCFVGTLSVSAADPYDATLTVADVNVKFGDTTATAVLHIAVAAPGINEAIINIDSTIGTIDAEPELDETTLVVDGGGDAYVDVVGDDFSKLFLSAREAEDATDLNGILSADIAVVFTLNEGVKPGTYPINIVTEGVKAADKNETVVNLVYTTVGNFVVTCDHANATEKVTTAPTCTEPGVKTFTCACGETWTEAVEATGKHEYTYVSDNAGKHTSTCTVGGETATEDCADNNADGACDKCEYALKVELEEIPLSKNTAKTVMVFNETVGSRITINYNVNANSVLQMGYSDYYIKVDYQKYNNYMLEPKSKILYPEERVTNLSSAKAHTFNFFEFSLYEMSIKYTITVYLLDAEGKEIAYYAIKDTSIKDQALALAKSTPAYAKTLVDMAMYGAEVQKYFAKSNPTKDIATAELPTVGFDDYLNMASTEAELPTDYNTTSSSKWEPSYQGSSLICAGDLLVDTSNLINFRIRTTGFDVNNLGVDIRYTNKHGDVVAPTINLSEMTPATNTQTTVIYRYTFNQLALYDLNKTITVTITENGNKAYTLDYCAGKFIYDNINGANRSLYVRMVLFAESIATALNEK